MSDGTPDTLIDDLMDAYLGWCGESAAVETAYQRWSIAPAADAAGTFAAYVAALDREELASVEYARRYAHSKAELARQRRRREWLGDAA
jgi:hypothetical protein